MLYCTAENYRMQIYWFPVHFTTPGPLKRDNEDQYQASDREGSRFLWNFDERKIKYQPSGEGGTRSPPATPHTLQHHHRLLTSKWPTGSGNKSNPCLLDPLNNFREKSFLIRSFPFWEPQKFKMAARGPYQFSKFKCLPCVHFFRIFNTQLSEIFFVLKSLYLGQYLS